MNKDNLNFILILILMGGLLYLLWADNNSVSGGNELDMALGAPVVVTATSPPIVTVVVTAAPVPDDVTITVLEDDSTPVIHDLVPTAVQLASTPRSTAVQENRATPTAISPYEPPPGGYTEEYLSDCAEAMRGNRRAHPRCPANAAEMLAGGGR